MWNNKVPETISEHPDEEDKESNHCDNFEDNKKSNKINKILDICKSQNSDYNHLFKDKKTPSKNKYSTNNNTNTNIVPLEDRPSIMPKKAEEDNDTVIV